MVHPRASKQSHSRPHLLHKSAYYDQGSCRAPTRDSYLQDAGATVYARQLKYGTTVQAQPYAGRLTYIGTDCTVPRIPTIQHVSQYFASVKLHTGDNKLLNAFRCALQHAMDGAHMLKPAALRPRGGLRAAELSIAPFLQPCTTGMTDVCTSKKIPEELINEVICQYTLQLQRNLLVFLASEFGIGIGDMDIELHMAHHTKSSACSQNGCSMRQGKQPSHKFIQLLTQLHIHATSWHRRN